MSGNGQPNADDLATVAFTTGVGPDGKLNTVNFWRWDRNDPPTYTNNDISAHKWAGGAAGSAGGNVTYCFDAGSEWTGAEEGIFRSALSLWSAVANITFTEASTPATAKVVFYRYGTDTTPPGPDARPGRRLYGRVIRPGQAGRRHRAGRPRRLHLDRHRRL